MTKSPSEQPHLKVVKWNRKPIAFPGIYSGVPMDAYHGGDLFAEPAISSTGLRKIFCPGSYQKHAPAYYWAESPYNPERVEGKDTDSRTTGRAAHHLILGEKEFKSQFAIRPARLGGEAWHSNRTACKLWLEERAKEGRTVVTETTAAHVAGMAKSLMREPLIKAGLLNGLIEHSMFWKDKATGVWLKVRPDVLPNDSLDFVDFKTTTSVMWSDLQKTIREYGYYQQAGLVAEGVQQVLGRPINSFTLVFIESQPPYCVEIVTVKEGDIARGIKANRIAITKFAECWKAKEWPGPRGKRDDARYIEMNEWDQKRIDESLNVGIV